MPAQRVFWIIRDRRTPEEKLCRDVVDGRLNSVYYDPDSAKRDKYVTEKVWKIQIAATEEK